jgi:hypothetical protein
MSETTVQERMAALRTDDGLIEGAVAELNTKLAAWVAAMRRGQAALLDDGVRVSAAPTGEACSKQPTASCEQRHGTAIRRGGKLFAGQVPTSTAAEYHRPTSGAPTPALTHEAASPADDDDEALLAGLDAETASAIQVKRRLAGNQRSVRELLDEIRSEESAAKQAESERTRWWRRGNERRDR